MSRYLLPGEMGDATTRVEKNQKGPPMEAASNNTAIQRTFLPRPVVQRTMVFGKNIIVVKKSSNLCEIRHQVFGL